MPARRIKSLHHNLPEGVHVVFHREHRSKRGRTPSKVFKPNMTPYPVRGSKRNTRWKGSEGGSSKVWV